jgi:hypothetical protein
VREREILVVTLRAGPHCEPVPFYRLAQEIRAFSPDLLQSTEYVCWGTPIAVTACQTALSLASEKLQDFFVDLLQPPQGFQADVVPLPAEGEDWGRGRGSLRRACFLRTCLRGTGRAGLVPPSWPLGAFLLPQAHLSCGRSAKGVFAPRAS